MKVDSINQLSFGISAMFSAINFTILLNDYSLMLTTLLIMHIWSYVDTNDKLLLIHPPVKIILP